MAFIFKMTRQNFLYFFISLSLFFIFLSFFIFAAASPDSPSPGCSGSWAEPCWGLERPPGGPKQQQLGVQRRIPQAWTPHSGLLALPFQYSHATFNFFTVMILCWSILPINDNDLDISITIIKKYFFEYFVISISIFFLYILVCTWEPCLVVLWGRIYSSLNAQQSLSARLEIGLRCLS